MTVSPSPVGWGEKPQHCYQRAESAPAAEVQKLNARRLPSSVGQRTDNNPGTTKVPGQATIDPAFAVTPLLPSQYDDIRKIDGSCVDF
jgi:hypothetical protein